MPTTLLRAAILALFMFAGSGLSARAADSSDSKGMSAGVSSLDVTEANYSAGTFQQDGPKSWVERHANGEVAFQFIETARSADGVMLYDTGRNVFLRLDIASRIVWYGEGVAPSARLYDITSASTGTAGTLQVAAASTPAPSPAPLADGQNGTTDDEACKRLGTIRSQNSNTPTMITFDNKTGQDRMVMWIGFDGVPKDYGIIHPGERKEFKTFLTHPWMITDMPGNCVQIDMPITNGSVNFIAIDQSAPSTVAPIKTYVAPKVVKKATTVRTSCPPGTVPVPQTDNCVKLKVKARSPCPTGQYLEGATGICRKPGWANVPQTSKELKANHGCGRTQQWNPQSGQCEEND